MVSVILVMFELLPPRTKGDAVGNVLESFEERFVIRVVQLQLVGEKEPSTY